MIVWQEPSYHRAFVQIWHWSRYVWCHNVPTTNEVLIAFDDKSTCKDQWLSDRSADGRDIFEMLNKNFVIPSEYLAIAKTLYHMRHQIAFRQYNPKKLHKYGLLLKSINDSRFHFTYKAAPYAGKPENGDGPYRICVTEDYGKYLVNEVEKDASLKGRNISVDHSYTSAP